MSSDGAFYGECRFCLALGEHKDVTKEYLNGECREVYYDMFLECFNVFLITPRGANLICKGCVQRLRDANSFRNMVINAEKGLQAACQRYQIEPVEVPPEIKYELVSDVKVEEAQELEYVKSDEPELVDVQSDDPESVDVQSDDQESVDVQSADEESVDIQSAYQESLDVQSDDQESVDVQSAYQESVDVQSAYQESVDVQSNDQELVDVKSDDEVLEDDKSDDVVFASESPFLQCRDTKSPITELLTVAPPTTVTWSLDELKPCFVRLTRLINSIDIYECEFCLQVFNYKSRLHDHIVKVHMGDDTKVSDLDFTDDNTEPTNGVELSKEQNIVASNENVDVKKRRLCKICDKQLFSFASLKNHMRWHRGEEPLICGICKKQFSRKSALEDHVAIRHSKDKHKPYSCDICKRSYKIKAYVERHIRLVHNRERKRYKCEHCGRILHGYCSFKVHLNLHAAEKPYKCQICDQGFASQPSLQYHSYKHAETRPEKIYDCKICSKVFSNPKSLKSHFKYMHEKGKLIKCQYCALRFTSKSGLKAHEERHRASPHSCTICKKTFPYKHTLQRHSLVHTKDKPHLCDTCGRGFTKKEYLVDHLNSHTGVKAYSCPSCKSEFTHGYQKTWHVKKCKAFNATKYATQSKNAKGSKKVK